MTVETVTGSTAPASLERASFGSGQPALGFRAYAARTVSRTV